jgi:hypothetical protein
MAKGFTKHEKDTASLHRGASTSSDIITDFLNKTAATSSAIADHQANLRSEVSDVTVIVDTVGAGVARVLTHISDTLDLMDSTAYPSNKTIITMRDHTLVSTAEGINNTLKLNTRYGQLTLRNNNVVVNKLIAQDISGKVWVPESTNLWYWYEHMATLQPTEPTDADPSTYQVEEYSYAKKAFDNEPGTAWYKTSMVTSTIRAKIRISMPVNVGSNNKVNAIAIHPLGEGGIDLRGFKYYTPSSYVGTELVGTTSRINFMPATLLHLRSVPDVISFEIELDSAIKGLNNRTIFGLWHVGAYELIYDSGGSITWDLSDVLPASVATLSVSKVYGPKYIYGSSRLVTEGITVSADASEKTATLSMKRLPDGSTPVVEQIEVSWDPT